MHNSQLFCNFARNWYDDTRITEEICLVTAGGRTGKDVREKVAENGFSRRTYVLVRADGVWKLGVEDKILDHSLHLAGR